MPIYIQPPRCDIIIGMKSEKVRKQVTTKLSDVKENVVVKSQSKKFKYLTAGLGVIIVLGLILYKGKGLIVAATVNGQPISRLKVVNDLEKQGGKQVLDSIVTKTLIMQQASKKGIVITDSEIKTEETNLEKTLSGQGTTLDSALSMQNMTRADLDEQIRIQKTVEALLKDKLTVTDKEVQDYFDKNKSSFPKDSKLETVKAQIQDQLYKTKLSSEYQTWIDALKKSSKINYFVSF